MLCQQPNDPGAAPLPTVIVSATCHRPRAANCCCATGQRRWRHPRRTPARLLRTHVCPRPAWLHRERQRTEARGHAAASCTRDTECLTKAASRRHRQPRLWWLGLQTRTQDVVGACKMATATATAPATAASNQAGGGRATTHRQASVQALALGTAAMMANATLTSLHKPIETHR